ncbi:MAG: DEAD/DEAH box helicase, partial [Verrucomicrobiota bacterium]
ELREKLTPVLLRRTRDSVLSELPPRTTEIVRITPTQEQADIGRAQMQIVSSILGKPFLTEMDILRLQKALLLARMAADSTYLVNKEAPGYSSKLERLGELLENLGSEPGRKIVLFSEWTTMLTLIEEQINALGLGYVRLDGQVPQKKRQKLVHQFQNDPDCRLFITTNAGSTGLNLQSANTVINVDLPWNPALLEQRIGRAHRMGQKRPVHVYLLVTEESLEEKMMASLSAKQDLALAVLDPEATVDQVKLVSGIEDLKKRLEILLGANPDSPIDESERERETREMEERRLKQRMLTENGGRLFDSALGLLSARRGINPQTVDPEMATHFKEALAECVQPDENGRPTLTLTLPDTQAIDRLAATLAGISSHTPETNPVEEQLKRNRKPGPS